MLTAEQQEYQVEYRRVHRDEIRLRQAAYRLAHPEVVRRTLAKSYRKHRDKRMRERAQYYQENREALLRDKATYYKDHRDVIRRSVAEYRRQHPEAVRRTNAKYDRAHPERGAEHDQRRRAQKRGVPSERFKHQEIFDRDRWVCQICGQPVGQSLRGRNPDAPSLDHRIPLAKGGPHTRANVQLAHYRCNMKKGPHGRA